MSDCCKGKVGNFCSDCGKPLTSGPLRAYATLMRHLEVNAAANEKRLQDLIARDPNHRFVNKRRGTAEKWRSWLTLLEAYGPPGEGDQKDS